MGTKGENLKSELVDIQQDKFVHFVEELYAVDFAGPQKIARKINRLARPPHRLVVLELRLDKPQMEAQDALNRVRCETIGDIKNDIRDRYRDKIEDYEYDVIVHSTEADYQTRPVRELLRKFAETSIVEP